MPDGTSRLTIRVEQKPGQFIIMKDMIKSNFVTALLIRRYRTRAGMNLCKSRNPNKARRKTSLQEEVTKRFPGTSLTQSRLIAIESQNLKRHQEPTPQELYQIAATLGVPMLALVIDGEDPYGDCQIARTKNPRAMGRIQNNIENMMVMESELLQWGSSETITGDARDGFGEFYRYLSNGHGEDPTYMCKCALAINMLSHILLMRIKNHEMHSLSEGMKQMYREQESRAAGVMMWYLRDLQVGGVMVPDGELNRVKQAVKAVRDYWNLEGVEASFAVPLDGEDVLENAYMRKFGKSRDRFAR